MSGPSLCICKRAIRMATSEEFLGRATESTRKSSSLCRVGPWSHLFPFPLHYSILEPNHFLPEHCCSLALCSCCSFHQAHPFLVISTYSNLIQPPKFNSKTTFPRKWPWRLFPSSDILWSIWPISCHTFLCHFIITYMFFLPYQSRSRASSPALTTPGCSANICSMNKREHRTKRVASNVLILMKTML